MDNRYTKPGFLPRDLSWEEKIEFIKKSSIGVPQKFEIDLGTAHNDLVLDLAGNFLYVVSTTNITDSVDIRFNEIREPFHTFTQQFGFYTPFYRLYISNEVIAGATMTILYGNLSRQFLDVLDNRSTALQASILGEMLLELTAIEEKMNGIRGDGGIYLSASGAGLATVVVYTVPANKVLKISCESMAVTNADVGGTCILRVRDAADLFQYDILTLIGTALINGQSSSMSNPSPINVPAGYDVVLEVAAGVIGYTFINCWLEDA